MTHLRLEELLEIILRKHVSNFDKNFDQQEILVILDEFDNISEHLDGSKLII
jgi:hypothetical protein